jgi:transcription elongation factor Elf1
MAGASKNSRTTVATQKFICPDCGGEIEMKTLCENGRLKNVAKCTKCNRTERRPKDFK